MRKKVQPKSSADVTESESDGSSNSSIGDEAEPTTSQNVFDEAASDSGAEEKLNENGTGSGSDSDVIVANKKRKVLRRAAQQEIQQNDSDDFDSDSDEE